MTSYIVYKIHIKGTRTHVYSYYSLFVIIFINFNIFGILFDYFYISRT